MGRRAVCVRQREGEGVGRLSVCGCYWSERVAFDDKHRRLSPVAELHNQRDPNRKAGGKGVKSSDQLYASCGKRRVEPGGCLLDEPTRGRLLGGHTSPTEIPLVLICTLGRKQEMRQTTRLFLVAQAQRHTPLQLPLALTHGILAAVGLPRSGSNRRTRTEIRGYDNQHRRGGMLYSWLTAPFGLPQKPTSQKQGPGNC